ncbi:hypothetical protein M404DRAFT_32563 [Pisolithus tinctorius Marx 270]|uniref:Myb/SANT-like domain-containing protein n=1 Tax=Pisolithus tinctorius Marx 270 TaxID=870435 RepID=A0A0C3N860_PISTI|nr:hypothetical protein M404DRAFT_32563 [Pisolithus tinctorius Marx 270]
MLLDFVEEIRPKAGDRMVFQVGHFNDLVSRLPVQANGYHKTAKSRYDKWESLKWDYYAALAVARGLGLTYSAARGADVVTEAGQLVMDDVIENRPDTAQYQNTGFKYFDRMRDLALPDKARGTNAHHAAGARPPAQRSRASTSMSSDFPSSIVHPVILPQLASMQLPTPPSFPQPAVQHQLPFTHPHMQYQLPPVQPATQFTFVQDQSGFPNQHQIMQTPWSVQPAVNVQGTPVPQGISQALSSVPPVSLPGPMVSPSSIPTSPPSSAMTSVSTSINPSSSLLSRGKKCKSDATAGLDTTSTAASLGSSSGSRKRHLQMAGLEDAVQDLMSGVQDSTSKTLTALNNPKGQSLDEACVLMFELEKNLLEQNLVHLQMLFEEKSSYVAGYKNAATQSATYRMLWVKMRLEATGYEVPEYANLGGK